MAMEAEMMSTLIGAYAMVMGIAVMIVIWLFWSRRQAGYAWILAHFATFTWAVWKWIELIHPHRVFKEGPAMASEENSLMLGAAGLIWALSMVFLLIGIASLGSRRKA